MIFQTLPSFIEMYSDFRDTLYKNGFYNDWETTKHPKKELDDHCCRQLDVRPDVGWRSWLSMDCSARDYEKGPALLKCLVRKKPFIGCTAYISPGHLHKNYSLQPGSALHLSMRTNKYYDFTTENWPTNFTITVNEWAVYNLHVTKSVKHKLIIAKHTRTHNF